MGQFISEDPIGLAGGSNLYSYVGNNPVNLVDPDGLTAQGAANGAAIGASVAAAASIVADAATGGVNIAATPAEIAEGAAIGGAIGDIISNAMDDASSSDASSSSSSDSASSSEDKGCPPPDKKNCEALRQSILNTCYGLTGRKRMACYEAANTAYRQCMGYE